MSMRTSQFFNDSFINRYFGNRYFLVNKNIVGILSILSNVIKYDDDFIIS